MRIENFNINKHSKVFIIAELSANHNGNLDTAIQTILAAKRAGADCIKLQTYTASIWQCVYIYPHSRCFVVKTVECYNMGHSMKLPPKTNNKTNFILQHLIAQHIWVKNIICFVNFSGGCNVGSHSDFLSIIKCVLLSVFGGNLWNDPDISGDDLPISL